MRRNSSSRRSLVHLFVGIVFVTLASACHVDEPIDEREDPPAPPPEEESAMMVDTTLREVEADDEDAMPEDESEDE
ncbi:MAG: hypothetical protein IPM54_45525 [Polyangiaceae bacterium]|nr:hypothetical protein [Polyangiaceae bacterium]